MEVRKEERVVVRVQGSNGYVRSSGRGRQTSRSSPRLAGCLRGPLRILHRDMSVWQLRSVRLCERARAEALSRFNSYHPS